jgi:hypothetical protein
MWPSTRGGPLACPSPANGLAVEPLALLTHSDANRSFAARARVRPHLIFHLLVTPERVEVRVLKLRAVEEDVLPALRPDEAETALANQPSYLSPQASVPFQASTF